MSEFKRYPVEINGVQTTLRLNERQARARGLWVDDEPAPEPKKAAPAKKQAPKAANKARTAKNKAK